ncbi:hypothetical protein NDU88_002014 [Pleurodeles waltl]|uniref:Uncharacterized protein n=1 Tax=Pleurodeles waltl TaxID=8319 RepID=A0AAV7KR10_PLEWA|nr:hypothetical protein NDU88_002014 [Pleurodeles waltl]
MQASRTHANSQHVTGAWPGSGTWRTPSDSAPEGPAEKLRTSAPARAARAPSPSAVRLTGGRRGWATAVDPRYAVGCAEPPRSSGGLRSLLPFKAAALRGKAGRGVSRRSGPREAAAAAAGSSGRTAGTGEPVGCRGSRRSAGSLEPLIGGQHGGTMDFPDILGHRRPLSVGIVQVRESNHGRSGTTGEEVGALCGETAGPRLRCSPDAGWWGGPC